MKAMAIRSTMLLCFHHPADGCAGVVIVLIFPDNERYSAHAASKFRDSKIDTLFSRGKTAFIIPE
jgi:hypothetical protein